MGFLKLNTALPQLSQKKNNSSGFFVFKIKGGASRTPPNHQHSVVLIYQNLLAESQLSPHLPNLSD